MVLQFVGFMAAFRAPRACRPSRRNSRRPSCHVGYVRALLSLDIPWRAVCRKVAKGARFERSPVSNHRCGGRRYPQSGRLVRIHTVFGATVPVRSGPFAFDAPVLSSLDPWALGLSVAAAVAIFRFKAGMIPTLASSARRVSSCISQVQSVKSKRGVRPCVRYSSVLQPSFLPSHFQRQSFAAGIDWSKVDSGLGKPAAVQGDVHRYGIPRSDLQGDPGRCRDQTSIGALEVGLRSSPSRIAQCSWAISCSRKPR